MARLQAQIHVHVLGGGGAECTDRAVARSLHRLPGNSQSKKTGPRGARGPRQMQTASNAQVQPPRASTAGT